jgi:fluoride exporter
MRATRSSLGGVQELDTVAAIAIGGIIGAEGRYAVGRAMPHVPPQFPTSTLLINISGCVLIGVLMAVLGQFTTPHRLVRPFLAIGILGGYTTYSTFAVDVQQLLVRHRPATAFEYLVATAVGCALAVWVATWATIRASRTVTTARRLLQKSIEPES